MDEQGIRQLAASIDKLIEVLDNQTKEFRAAIAPMKELPELTRNTQETVQQGFSDLQAVTVQLRLAEIGSQVDAYEGMAAAEKAALEEKAAQLAADIKRISKRYQQLLMEVETSTEEKVRELDDPVLQILEVFYPSLIEARYVDRLLPGRRAIASQAQWMASARSEVLAAAVDKLRAALTSFVDARAEAGAILSRYSRGGLAAPMERSIGVVVMRRRGVVVTEALAPNDSGAEELQQLFESSLENGKFDFGPGSDSAPREALIEAVQHLAVKMASTDPVGSKAAEVVVAELEAGNVDILEVRQ